MEPLRDLDLVRAAPASAMEMRADGDGGMPTMVVRFSPFNTWYEIDSFWEGQFLERTVQTSFKRTIKNNGDQVKVLYDHGMDFQVGNKVLGIPENLREEPDSPVGDVPLLDTSYNRDLLPGLEAGAYGSSFRFKVVRDEWVDEPEPSDYNPKGIPERTIKEVRLFEFGPVTFPANPAATAGLRCLTDWYYERLRSREPQRVEELARAAGKRLPAAPTVIDLSTLRTPDAGSADGTPAAGPATAPSSDPAERHSDAPPEPNGSTRTEPKKEKPPVDTMTVEERVARQSEIRARLAEIDTEYAGAELPEDIQAEWDTLSDEDTRHEKAVTATRQRQAYLRSLAAAGSTEHGSDSARSAPAANGRRPENIYDLAEIRQQARSIDELPQLYRDNAMRAVEQARFPGVRNREDAQRHVEHLLDTVPDKDGLLARRILVTGSPVYQRAFGKYCAALNTHGLTAEEQRALAIGAGGTGGFAVPFQLDPTIILTNAGSVNPLRQISRVEPIVGKEWDGITSAGVTVSRAAEAAESSDNAPTLVQPTVKAERVQGFIPFSIEVDQDWAALQSEMTRLLADAKDVEEAASFVTGTGVSPQANGVVQTLNASSNVTANTFTIASLYALDEALPDRFRDNASFLAHRATYNVVRQFDTAGGANLWVRLPDGQGNELLGYPAYRSSAMDSTPAGTIGDRYLLLGDFRQFLIVDRLGMTVDVVPHLFGAGRMPTGQRGLYAIWRNNSKILTDNAFRILNKAA